MTNYDAILRMTPEQMESFLDQIYLTGLNTGLYAARQEEDDLLEDNPFGSWWLRQPAEEATRSSPDLDGEEFLLSALVKAIFRNAGISLEDNDINNDQKENTHDN